MGWLRGRDRGLLGRAGVSGAWDSSIVSAGRSGGQSPGCWGRGDRGMKSSCWARGSGRGGGDGPCSAGRGGGIPCLPFVCFMRRG